MIFNYITLYLYHTKQQNAIQMKEYLENLITEKGTSLDQEITIEGHFGFTYAHLIEFISQIPAHEKSKIKNNLVYIDCLNGDVFDFLDYLAKGACEIMFPGWC